MSLALLSLVFPLLAAVSTAPSDEPSAVPSAPTMPSQDVPATRDSVHVIVDAKSHDEPMFLVRLRTNGPTGPERQWPPTPVCTLPCEAWVVPGAYRVVGDGRVDSERFDLRGGDNAHQTVDAGTTAGRKGGFALIGVGGGIILLGLIAWGCIALKESIDHEDTSNARNVGLGFTITGLSVMAVGVVV